MKIWFKLWKDNHLLTDYVAEDETEETRTHKIFNALDEACYTFNVGRPIWLDVTIRDFKKFSKARFYQDSFMEEIPFEYLEIHVLEED